LAFDNKDLENARKILFEALKLSFLEMKIRFDEISYLNLNKKSKKACYQYKRMFITSCLAMLNIGLIFELMKNNTEALECYK